MLNHFLLFLKIQIIISLFAFQFDKPYKIQSIDIGNDGSAFVEVLVGRASATSDQDYQVRSCEDFDLVGLIIQNE